MANSIEIKDPLVELAIEDVRLRYVSLHENETYEGEERDYKSATILLDKTDHADLIAEFKRVAKAYKDSYGKKIKNMPISDGDKINEAKADDGDDIDESLVNKIVIKTVGSSITMLDGQMRPMQSPEVIKDTLYAGSHVNCFITTSAFDNKFGSTMRVNLTGIMFAGDDEVLTGGVSATKADKFSSFSKVQDTAKKDTAKKDTGSADADDDDDF